MINPIRRPIRAIQADHVDGIGHAAVSLYFATKEDLEHVEQVIKTHREEYRRHFYTSRPKPISKKPLAKFSLTKEQEENIGKQLQARTHSGFQAILDRLPYDEHGQKYELVVYRHRPHMDHHELYKFLLDRQLIEPELLEHCGIIYRSAEGDPTVP